MLPNLFSKRIAQLHRHVKASSPAFSLIEMSFVLCIMGLLLSYAIPSYMNVRKVAKIKETERKIESLCYVLAAYAQNNGILPCATHKPAVAPVQGQGYTGRAVIGLQKGIIPYVTLGISENDAKDGFGGWITYAVSKSASTPPQQSPMQAMQSSRHPGKPYTFCTLKSLNQEPNPLTVHAPAGTISERTEMQHDFLAFVLISHGPSGVGALEGIGSGTSPEKKQNASASMIVYDIPKSETFDDSVRWVTRNNLMAIYAKQPCLTP